MQIVVSIGDPVESQTTLYDGASLDLMEDAIYGYLGEDDTRYTRRVKRWWVEDGRVHADNGLEPELRLFKDGVLESWKIWQTPVGS